ncbi:MAG: hypothetical protein KKE09_17090 [Bacteroidetes bacterium]|nr:hypothetical protein [Bacteroidota bacterium]
MSWVCPNCEREFRATNQFHSCEQSTIEQHIEDKPEFIVKIFHKLLDLVTSFGEVELLPLKTSIQVRTKSAFLAIYLKRNKVHLEFQLAHESKIKQITKTIRISKRRVFHYADVFSVDEIDNKLELELKEAYNTIAKSEYNSN